MHKHVLPMRSSRFLALAAVFGTVACTRFGAVYPPRPAASSSPIAADPAPSRIALHVSVTRDALAAALDAAVPAIGQGEAPLLGSKRNYTWERTPLDVSFSQGRIVLDTHVSAHLDVRLGAIALGMDLHVVAEPVVNTDYQVKLQSTEVKVTTADRTLNVADKVANVLDLIANQVKGQLVAFSYDLKPMVGEAYARVGKPLALPVGDATGCASLKILGVEAGPTVVADGLEKDLALIVAPSVSLPCAAEASLLATPLPPLSNVASVPSGPFTVTIPIVATYEELTRALSAAFTDGKLYFSTDFPGLYLSNPELYEADATLVLKLHLHGPVHKLGIDTDLDGDVFFSGHLKLADNELQIPDLEPTIETSNLLLSLKAMADGAKIRDQARAALRLDIGARLKAVRDKLGPELTFGTADACFHGDVDKIEVTGAYPHGTYVRVYVAVTGRARVTLPCAAAR